MSVFSLTGGYQGEHASQPHTTWNTIITHILGKHVRIHGWHCSNIQTHAHPQTCARTHRTKSKANNVSESLTPFSPLPPLPDLYVILSGNNGNETNLSKKLLRRKPSMSACGVLAGEITENHFHYETSDNQEKEQGGRRESKKERKKDTEHTFSSYNMACL